MAVHKKFPALGRGLDALISTDEVLTQGSGSINEVDIDRVSPNPNQPRREFSDESLRELSQSIREIGLIQPITVRMMEDGSFIIIAGERRWRASKMAGLRTVPAYIRTVDDENMMEMALVENIQREDLNPMEIALAYQHLMEEYKMTQETLAQKVGKSRPAVTNYLRLLKLPAAIQMALVKREIDMGHAKALLSLQSPSMQMKAFEEIKAEGMTVRKAESMAKELSEGGSVKIGGKRVKAKGSTLSAEYADLKRELATMFKAKVQLTCSSTGRGKITIPFTGENDLVRIIEMFDQLKR